MSGGMDHVCPGNACRVPGCEHARHRPRREVTGLDRLISTDMAPAVRASAPVAAELVGQPDPVMIDAARRAGDVLAGLVGLARSVEAMAATDDARRRQRQLGGINRRFDEMRAELRPVSSIDTVARQRAQADVDETAQRIAPPIGRLLDDVERAVDQHRDLTRCYAVVALGRMVDGSRKSTAEIVIGRAGYTAQILMRRRLDRDMRMVAEVGDTAAAAVAKLLDTIAKA